MRTSVLPEHLISGEIATKRSFFLSLKKYCLDKQWLITKLWLPKRISFTINEVSFEFFTRYRLQMEINFRLKMIINLIHYISGCIKVNSYCTVHTLTDINNIYHMYENCVCSTYLNSLCLRTYLQPIARTVAILQLTNKKFTPTSINETKTVNKTSK